MIIEKSKNIIGQYVARVTIGGHQYAGVGISHQAALQDLLDILKWNDIGNWEPVQHLADFVSNDTEDEDIEQMISDIDTAFKLIVKHL